MSPNKRHIAGVVFDMDGVLVDSEPLWHEAEIAVFGSLGVVLTPELCRQTTGVRIDAVVAHWRAAHPWGPWPSNEEVVNAIVDDVVARVASRAEPMRGVHSALRAVSGLKTGLASSSPQRLIDVVLDRLGLRGAFQVVQSAEHLPHGKPDPTVYLLACKALGLDPRHAVAIEDSDSGLRAAHAAGMIVVAVVDPAGPRPKGLGVADVVLESLEDFPAWLSRW
jgi:HAD superfamily hydrolase (TIGR01509 family)